MLQSCSRLGTRGLRSDWKKGTNTSAAAAALCKATGGTPSVTERENRRRGSETQAKAIRIGIGKVAAFAKQETEELRHKATKQTAAMVKRKGREDSQDSRKVKCSATSTSSASKADRTTTTYTAEDKLAKLRTLLEERSLCAYLVPTDDPHLCEMPPAAFRRREYVSGFTGSAGTAVVTTANALKDAKEEEEEKTKEEEELEREGEGEGEGANGHASVMGIRERERQEQEQEQEGAALLWTDGRYFLQAETELRGSSWNLMKSGMPKVLEPVDWLASNLKPGSRVGLDPMVVTVSMARQYSETLAAMQCALVPVEENLVDEVWAHDARPHFPNGKVRVHPMQYAGVDVKTKISKVREELEQEDANALLVNTLDEVAWLLNIRGADIENSPVVVAYVLVTEKETTLYIDQTKLSPEVNQHLDDAGVGVKAYDALKMDLEILCKDKESKIWIDPDQCTSGLFDLMCSTIQKNTDERKTKSGKDVRVLKDEQGNEFLYNVENGIVLPKGSEEEGEREGHVEGNHETTSIRLNDDSGKFVESKSPISLAKATKNEKEIDGLVTAHHRDGVALCQFLEWLEIQVLEEGQSPTEFEISEKLCEMRSKQTGFIEPSFPTIAGEGANGAIIHYRPEEHSSNSLSPNSMLLLDSGGQFDCGTTDVTRTVHFGDPTVYQKECFTRVLKGHIALSTLVFPEGIPGFMVDAFARSSLWRGGLDYRHGTGHGVGAGLNVHEGPQGISARYSNTTGLKDGMVLSNEPGYYEDGSFGIRIENLVWVSDAKTEKTFGDKKYLQFNDLTLVPIQKKLILESMLTEEEKRWLNDYHALVWERLHSELSGSTKEWLKRQTTPI